MGVAISFDSILGRDPLLDALAAKFDHWNERYESCLWDQDKVDPNFNWDVWHFEDIQLFRDLKAVFEDRIELRVTFGFEDPASKTCRKDDLLIL